LLNTPPRPFNHKKLLSIENTATRREITRKFANMASATSFYDFKPLDKKGTAYPLSNLKDKVVLVVNTASKCGFTPQFEGLEKLYKEVKAEYPGKLRSSFVSESKARYPNTLQTSRS
jgi:hypothetical protein